MLVNSRLVGLPERFLPVPTRVDQEYISYAWRCSVLTGVHIVVYSKDPDADRAFFKDTLGFRSVDAGRGWLIFAVPAAEVAFHPDNENNKHEMFFTCDDIEVQMADLRKKHVQVGETSEERWGTRTTISLPGGGTIGLYQPKHPVTFQTNSPKKKASPTRRQKAR